jgi:hypothetical protein
MKKALEFAAMVAFIFLLGCTLITAFFVVAELYGWIV